MPYPRLRYLLFATKSSIMDTERISWHPHYHCSWWSMDKKLWLEEGGFWSRSYYWRGSGWDMSWRDLGWLGVDWAVCSKDLSIRIFIIEMRASICARFGNAFMYGTHDFDFMNNSSSSSGGRVDVDLEHSGFFSHFHKVNDCLSHSFVFFVHAAPLICCRRPGVGRQRHRVWDSRYRRSITILLAINIGGAAK